MLDYYGKNCSTMLKVQYRMNQKIMAFSSKQLYDNELIADDSVKDITISELIDNSDINDEYEIADKPLIIINTSNCDFYETLDEETKSKYNKGEIEICKKIIEYLLNNLKLQKSNIGVITPYSAQVNFMNENMHFNTINEEDDSNKNILEISS